MRLTTILLICGGLSGLASAHEFYSTKLTWTRDISRIFYKRCVSCHHEGGSAFSLIKYEEARPWAKAIKDEVLNRRMPPWNAVKGFGNLYDDQSLTQEEISVISNWVEGGAPEGEAIYAPKPPKIDEGMTAAPTAPQISARFTDSTTVPADVELFGIMPTRMASGASAQVVATRPDGSIEPLLWVKISNPNHQQIYYFVQDVSLPAGSKIQSIPPGVGNFALYWKPAEPMKGRSASAASSLRR